MRSLYLIVLLMPALAIAECPTAAILAAPTLAGATLTTTAPDPLDAARSSVRLRDVLDRQARAACLEGSVDAGYVKQTEFDNTPYRFDMKPGEGVSAEQFDAWMRSRGIRIVRAKPDAAASAETTPVVEN